MYEAYQVAHVSIVVDDSKEVIANFPTLVEAEAFRDARNTHLENAPSPENFTEPFSWEPRSAGDLEADLFHIIDRLCVAEGMYAT